MTPVRSLAAALERGGLLLKQGRELPSVAALVAGEEPRGSWWSHPKGRAIFAALEQLEDEPGVLVAKLVSGKDTFVHRRLWPALLAVGRGGEEWQVRKLGAKARKLLGELASEGELGGAGAAGKELALRLLCVSRQEHTPSGRHETRLEDWTHWARRNGLGRSRMSAEMGRAALEEAVTRLGAPSSVLPWRRK